MSEASAAQIRKRPGRGWLRALQMIAFLAVFLILLHILSGILIRKTNSEYDLIRSFYRVDRQSLDVICLGSSHAYHSFQPNELWHEYGITSYVMGTPQQTIAGTYYLLKEAFRYQSPRVVLVETYYFKSRKPFVNEARMRCVADGMRPGPVKREMIRELLPDLTWQESLSWHIPFIAYHGRWAELTNADFHPLRWSKGSILLDIVDHDVTNPGLSGVEPVPMSDYAMGYLRKIKALCDEHGSQLILYSSPYGTGSEMDYRHYLKNQAKQMGYEDAAADLGVPYLYYQRDNTADIDFARDFSDTTHLNSDGARKLTLDLGRFITEHYDMPDHRCEKRFDPWDEDYEAYRLRRISGAPSGAAETETAETEDASGEN